jgi:hypothetical protein
MEYTCTDEVTIASGAVSTNNVRLWIEAKEMVGRGQADSRPECIFEGPWIDAYQRSAVQLSPLPSNAHKLRTCAAARRQSPVLSQTIATGVATGLRYAVRNVTCPRGELLTPEASLKAPRDLNTQKTQLMSTMPCKKNKIILGYKITDHLKTCLIST